MTLCTRIAIKPTPIEPLFALCRELLGADESVEVIRGPSRTPGVAELRHNPGVGLPAWLWVYYGADGPMFAEPYEGEDEADRASREKDPTQNGWAAIEVTFDTAYGYTTGNGGHCGDLHSWLVREVGRYLDGRSVEWKWQDECTGEWFNRHDGLRTLGDPERGALIPSPRAALRRYVEEK